MCFSSTISTYVKYTIAKCIRLAASEEFKSQCENSDYHGAVLKCFARYSEFIQISSCRMFFRHCAPFGEIPLCLRQGDETADTERIRKICFLFPCRAFCFALFCLLFLFFVAALKNILGAFQFSTTAS